MEATAQRTPLTRFNYERYVESGVTYEQYKENFAAELALEDASEYAQYLPLNWQRMNRVEKNFHFNTDLQQALQQLYHRTYWLVLTEHWCGDAAQIIPVLNEIAKASNGKISMRLVYRDQNPQLMDAHLTGNSRSIPKVIQLDTHFNVNGIWGPRPNEAQKLVLTLRSNPATANAYAEALHKWYAIDKQQSIQKELLKLVQRAGIFCPDCFR
jgi:thioredoxin-like negative regulator of GroEL